MSDIVEGLQKLANLARAGLITPEEFTSAKRKLLESVQVIPPAEPECLLLDNRVAEPVSTSDEPLEQIPHPNPGVIGQILHFLGLTPDQNYVNPLDNYRRARLAEQQQQAEQGMSAGTNAMLNIGALYAGYKISRHLRGR